MSYFHAISVYGCQKRMDEVGNSFLCNMWTKVWLVKELLCRYSIAGIVIECVYIHFHCLRIIACILQLVIISSHDVVTTIVEILFL